MKLSTIATLAPGAVIPSSSRDPGNKGDSPDFGSLLGDMMPEVSSESVTAAGAGTMGSDLVVASKPGTGAASASSPMMRTVDGTTTDLTQSSADDKNVQPSSLVRAAQPSTTAPVGLAGAATDSVSVADLLTLATRAADQGGPGSPVRRSSSDGPSAPRSPGVQGKDVDASPTPLDQRAGAPEMNADRVHKKRSSLEDEGVPPAPDKETMISGSSIAAAGFVAAPTAIVPSVVPVATTSASEDAAPRLATPSLADSRCRGADVDAGLADVLPSPSGGPILQATHLVPREDNHAAPTTWDTVDAARGAAAPAIDPTERPTTDTAYAAPGPSATAGAIVPIAPPASPIESRIVPGTVSIERHLGFHAAMPGSWEPTGIVATAISESGVVPIAVRRASGAEASPGRLTASAVADAKITVAPTGVAEVASASPHAPDASITAPPSVTDATKAVVPTGVAGAASASSPAPDASITAPSSLADATPAVAPTDVAAAMSMATDVPPVARQVADAIVTLAATPPDQATRFPQVAPARTMALQLAPEGLGMVTVRLHLSGRGLDVRLDVADGRTAAVIDRERDILTSVLRSSDYQLQSLSVTTHDATMPGGPHADRGTDARPSDPFGDRSPDGGAAGGREGGTGSRDQQDGGATPQRRPPPRAVSLRSGAALFV